MSAVPQEIASSAIPGLITAAFPKVGEYWPDQGGKFRGICKGADGQPDYFLIEHDLELPIANWQDSLNAAAAIECDGHKDFSLPNRAEAALLYANAKAEHLTDDWYWTSEQHASYPTCAWMQEFSNGYQASFPKGYDYRARAVRRKPIQ